MKLILTPKLMLVFLTLFLNPALASECFSVRDPDKRQACLAEERGEPADCLGVRDPDDRTICRQRAQQARRWRDVR